MEIIIWIIAGIIYFIANANGQTGRLSNNDGYGRYGVWGMQDDFSLEYNPLDDIRHNYEKRLQLYYQHNPPKTYLINRYCEARLIKEDDGNVWFYVKGRSGGMTSGGYFEVEGDSIHASTMWAFIDMEFNSLTRYHDIRDLYYKLNQGAETRGGLKFFYQPVFRTLPRPIINKMAQNELCRMEIQTTPDGKKVIICSEIWGNIEYDKPRRFIIKGMTPILYGILADFSKDGNKMRDYLYLLYQYKNRTDCTIEELDPNVVLPEDTSSAKELLEKAEQKEKEPESIKYLHVELEELNDTKDTENKEDTLELEKPEIKKYNERNLDI